MSDVASMLLRRAWITRDDALLQKGGSTKVGAAVRVLHSNEMFSGCNVQSPWRNDVHAEVCAIAQTVAHGYTRIDAIAVVAERDFFSPCGACLDWIFALGGPECRVIAANRNGTFLDLKAADLMPYYPR